MSSAVVVPWFDTKRRDWFLEAWRVPSGGYDWLIMQHDADREGCGVTKNRGVGEAMKRGYDIVVVLDDDCYPDSSHPNGVRTLGELRAAHAYALRPVDVEMFTAVGDPPTRGTPFRQTTIKMPVAASMGFWTEVADWDAVRQLVHGAGFPMRFKREPIYQRYFPLSGMNIAFHAAQWMPWCQFIDVPRFDDIWMGWIWQRRAYELGYCFNLRGPIVRHVRRSDMWANLACEVKYLSTNESLWHRIATHPEPTYENLRALMPDVC